MRTQRILRLARKRLPIGVDRFGVGKHLLRRPCDVRAQAAARLDPVPAARGDGVAVLDADRGHHCTGGVVAPGEAGAWLLSGIHQLGEEICAPSGGNGKLVLVRELPDCYVGFLAAHTVDRAGIIARDCEQPLNASVACLIGIVAGFFRKRNDVALFAFGRLYGGE